MSITRLVLQGDSYQFPYLADADARRIISRQPDTMVTILWTKFPTLKETIVYGEGCLAEDNLALAMFRQALETHDWTYHYSDDPSVWKRGGTEAHRIAFLRSNLKDRGLVQGEVLYEELAWKDPNA